MNRFENPRRAHGLANPPGTPSRSNFELRTSNFELAVHNAPAILGWDIGGANIKAALLANGSLRAAIRAHAVWKDPAGLQRVVAEIGRELSVPGLMAVTMTAELADCFRTKSEGVAFVVGALRSAFPDADLRLFGSDAAFRSPESALEQPLTVASANWAATAALVSRHARDALLIDVGTTTTDITAIVAGRVAAAGRTDPERLASGELVYTGAVRTPICAVARTVPFRGRRCRTAAELFADTGVVHLWRGDLAESDRRADTADGRGLSRRDVAARLARVLCADETMITARDLDILSDHVSECQVRTIAGAIRQVLRRLGGRASRLALTAGIGSFLARRAAARAGLAVRDLAELLGVDSQAAPAVAVARLLLEEMT